MLNPFFNKKALEAGCDEAGRGCLAGPVFAAAVILPPDFDLPALNDSKKVTASMREKLRLQIECTALAWAIGVVEVTEIDQINILNASFLAMHRAIAALKIRPNLLLIDGNRFNAYQDIPHHCIIGGDGKYSAIAAASILAKTYRDAHMNTLHKKYPHYQWIQNKGYGTRLHREAIRDNGISIFHRKSFRLLPDNHA